MARDPVVQARVARRPQAEGTVDVHPGAVVLRDVAEGADRIGRTKPEKRAVDVAVMVRAACRASASITVTGSSASSDTGPPSAVWSPSTEAVRPHGRVGNPSTGVTGPVGIRWEHLPSPARMRCWQ